MFCGIKYMLYFFTRNFGGSDFFIAQFPDELPPRMENRANYNSLEYAPCAQTSTYEL
jgi:hypothetical protein